MLSFVESIACLYYRCDEIALFDFEFVLALPRETRQSEGVRQPECKFIITVRNNNLPIFKMKT